MSNFKKFSIGIFCSLAVILSAFLFIPKNSIDSVSAFTYNGETYSDKVWVYYNSGGSLTFGRDVWTDGTNYYMDYSSTHLIYNSSTRTWVSNTWTGLTHFMGENVWTDGINYYYSNGTEQYILDISTKTWSTMTWNGLSSFSGSNIWTDGIYYYHSNGNSYVLDVSTHTWSIKNFYNYNNQSLNIWGSHIYLVDSDVYYSYNSTALLKLNISTYQFLSVYISSFSLDSVYFWSDGVDYYYSNGSSQQYLFDFTNYSFTPVNFSIYNDIYGQDVFHIGSDTYYFRNNSKNGLWFVDFTDLLTGGYDVGYSDGYDVGYSDGETAGYTTGYEDGYDEGYDLSSNLGYQDGYEDGYDSGYNVGYNSGYDNGYLDYSKLGFFPYDNFNLPSGVNLSNVAYLQLWFDGSQYHLGNQFIFDESSSQWLYYAYNFPVPVNNAEYRYYYWFYDGYRVNAICSDNLFPSYYLNADGTFTEFTTSVNFNYYNNILSSKYLNLSAVSEFEGVLYVYSQEDNLFYKFNPLVHDFDLLNIAGLPSITSYTHLQNFVVLRDSSSHTDHLMINACYLYYRLLNGVADYQFNYYYCDLDSSSSLTMTFHSTFVRHQSNNGNLNVTESGFWTDGTSLYFAFTDISGKVANYSLMYIPAEEVNDPDSFERIVFPLLEGPIFVNYLKNFKDVQYLFTYIDYVGDTISTPNFRSTTTLVYTFHLYDIDMYDTGYNIGYVAGVDYSNRVVNKSSASYSTGYQDGVTNAGNYTFNGLLGSVIDVPVRTFTSLLNFNVLGVNIMDFLLGLMTLAFVVFIVKMVLGGK